MKTILIRHKRENKKKCSLEPIFHREDCIFLSYPGCKLPDVQNYVLLSFEGPLLSEKDRGFGLILLDGTWKRAVQMEKELFNNFKVERRSLPSTFKTAYPRRQLDCKNPEQGLASIEALYIAYLLTKRDAKGLLDNYYWKDLFLERNKELFLRFKQN